MLCLKRGYWVVESRLPHGLDITLREDPSRVRTPRSRADLGDASASGAQLGQRSGESSPQEKSQNQTQHQEFSKALPFGSGRARAPAGSDFR
jgi:hypothetical protein